MPEPSVDLSDDELVGALRRLGDRVAYPPTPDLAPSVRRRLERESSATFLDSTSSKSPRSFPSAAAWFDKARPELAEGLTSLGFARAFLLPVQRSLALAAVALVALVGVVLIFPPARSAVAERLGFPGILITHVPVISDTSETPPPQSSDVVPPWVGRTLGLGVPVTLEEARAEAAYRVLVPTASLLGAPDEVYLERSTPGGQVALVYRPRAGLPQVAPGGVGLLLIQFRGDLVSRPVFGKEVGPGTSIEVVDVDGAPGFWIDGRPHVFYSYRDEAGQAWTEEARLALNTLLWQRGDLILRLESALPKGEALRIAASLR